MRKAALLFVLLGCALGALVLGLTRSTRNEATRGAPQAVEPAEAPARRALEGPEAAGGRAKAAPRRPSESEAPSAKAPVRAQEVGGRVVVVDSSEVEHEHESGFVVFTLQSGDSRSHHEVVVLDGRWSATLAPAAHDEEIETLRAGACVLGGRRALPEPRAALALPADGRLDLRLRWPPAPRLHVRARDTGRELEEVVLCELPPASLGWTEDGERPGVELLKTARAVGPSPVQLGESRDALAPRILFARGEGHAWGRIQLEAEADAEPTLLLDPAGELELVVQGEPEKRWAEIELLSAAEREGRSYLDVKLGETKSFVLQDLPAGRYTAQARWYGQPLGSVVVEVLAGERVTAVIEVGSPSTRLVPLEGILELPEELHDVPGRDTVLLAFGLTERENRGAAYTTSNSFLIRRSEMVSEGGSLRLHWAGPAVQPGRYRVDTPFHFTAELDTGPDGTRTARISVPAVGQVSVSCVDEHGRELTSEGVVFASLTPRNFGPWYCPGNQGRYPNPQGFEVHQGPTLIYTRANLYEPAVRVLDVGPGTNEVVFHLRARTDDPLAPAQR